MNIRCDVCGKKVTTEVPASTIVRAWVECPECIEKKADVLERVEYEANGVNLILEVSEDGFTLYDGDTGKWIVDASLLSENGELFVGNEGIMPKETEHLWTNGYRIES